MAHMEMDHTTQTASLSGLWRDLLTRETVAVESAGIQAAIVSIRLTGAADELENDARRAESLLRRRLHRTDQVGATSSDSLSILISPTRDLTNTIEKVRSLAATLARHRIPVLTAFAHRRPGEHLLNTWARAEGEIDRSTFRNEHKHGLRV